MKARVKFEDKPWIRKTLKNSIRKNKLSQIFILRRTLKSENIYKLYKNKLVTVLRLAENSSITTSKKNDIKGTWAILNKAIYKSYVNCTQVKPLEIGVDVVSNTQLICNEFFSGIGPSFADKIHCNDLLTVSSRFKKQKQSISICE